MSADPDLDREIAAEEAALAELEQRRDEARRRLSELRAARDPAPSAQARTASGAVSSADWSPGRKVALFASLFRSHFVGRTPRRAAPAGRRDARTSGSAGSAGSPA